MGLERLRNIGIVAHIDAGKTTVSERMLFEGGIEHKIGQVDEGTAVMDWMPEERERGITITSAATHLPWREHAINLIDTPGHVDFGIEVERCLRVLDGAVLVVDAVAGVQAQTETVWRQLARHHVPALVFVNKCDRVGADFLAASASVRARLGARALPIQYPLLDDEGLRGVVDLIEQRAWTFPESGSRAMPVEVAVPASVADEVELLRGELIEALSEADDAILTAAVEERACEPELLRRALRRRAISGSLVPILCGAALRHIGIPTLLDAIIDYLPSPLDVPAVRGICPTTQVELERGASEDQPLCALLFKLQAESSGDLSFLRVYSGRLEVGTPLWNPRLRRHERVNRLYRMHSGARQAIESAGPGDIVAVSGPKASVTGDTLCDPAQPILLETLGAAEPVLSLIAEPVNTADRDKLRAALARLEREDPSFHQVEDESTGQWTLSGMGELHLEVLLHRLEQEFRAAARVGAPRVAYREAVRRAGRGSARVERALAGKQVFGAVDLEVAPLAPTAVGVEVCYAPDCAVPQALRAAVSETLISAAQVGPRFGFPLACARLVLTGGESRPRLDSEAGFTQAAIGALRRALEAAEIDLLEPIMEFTIEAPAEFASGILADLNARKAVVTRVEARGALRELGGSVPLYHMFGYASAVRSLSQGRAGISMVPAGHRAVPQTEYAARGLVWE